MKRKHNGGYSLIEVLIAIAVLGIVTVPATSALITAHRVNVKAENMLTAQLEVSSAVETLMAEGIKENLTNHTDDTKYPGVKITAKQHKESQDDGTEKVYPYFEVTVKSSKENMESVYVETFIRKVS